MTKTDWNNITDYIDTVGTTLKTFTFPKTQNFVSVTLRGNANVTYSIGSQSGTLTPGQSISVSEKITSFTLTALSGTQNVEVWATEDGTEKIEDNGVSLDDVVASLAERTQQLFVDLKKYGAKYDGVYNDALAFNAALADTANLPDYSTIFVPYGSTMHIKSSISVIRNLNFICYGNISVDTSNISAFVMGNATTTITLCTWEINNAYGTGKGNGQNLFELTNFKYNIVKLPVANNFQYIVHFNAASPAVGLGQNIWYFTQWLHCHMAIYYQGADVWSNAAWAEGNQWMGGFIALCDVGVQIDANIKAGSIIFQGAIDNSQVSGGKDWVNNVNLAQYTTGNLILSNFFRNGASTFAQNDTKFEPNTGSSINGFGTFYGNLNAVDLPTPTQGVNINNIGAIEIASTGVNYPYIDMKNSYGIDRNGRISMPDANTMTFQAGGTTHYAFAAKFSNDVSPTFSNTWANKQVTSGATTLNVTFPATQADINYGVEVTPSWNTTYWVTGKTTSQFTVNFGTAAPSTLTADIFTFRTSN